MDDGTSILELKGIGEKSQQLFAKVNIKTVGELLRYYPRDYETFRDLRLQIKDKSKYLWRVFLMRSD